MQAGEGDSLSITGTAAFQSNASHAIRAIRAMARASLGVAVLPAWLVEQDLASGELQRVLPQYSLPAQPISVVYPHSSHVPHKTRVFIDFLCEHLGR